MKSSQQRRIASSIESLREWRKAQSIEDRMAALGITEEEPPKLTLLITPEVSAPPQAALHNNRAGVGGG